jgi:LysM repeat protein
MKQLCSLVIILFVWSHTTLSGQSLHLVLFSATNDPSIGEGCRINYHKTIREVKKMAQLAGLQYQGYCTAGRLASPAQVKAKLSAVNIQKNDVVIFHYSGHAVNDGRSRWPQLLLNGGTLRLASVHQFLKDSPAKLTLTIGDCCNTTYFARRSKSSKNSIQVRSKGNLAQGYQKLLKQTSGHWIVSGSRKGRSSYYNGLVGGFMTFALFEGLYQVAQQASIPSWHEVFATMTSHTQQLAQELGKTQTPQFKKAPLPVLRASPLGNDQPMQKFPDIGSNEEVTYTIKYNDSFALIAQKFAKAKGFQIMPHDIAQYNGLPINATILPEQKLKIANKQFKSSRYKVKAGDSLGKIAQQLQIPLNALIQWNPNVEVLKKGQILVIHHRK